MARYGTFLYSTQKYGTGPDADNLRWTCQIAWDGTFAGENEAGWLVDLRIERGRNYLLNPGGKSFERYDVGKAKLTLINNDGRYDPYNTSSPLYPNVKPGKYVRLAVKNGAAGTNYGLLRGTVADIQPFGKGRDQFVRIEVVDGLRWLADRMVLVGLAEAQNIKDSIQEILTDAGWPSTEWPISFSNAVDTLDYWWAWKENALAAIHVLEDAELGIFFHDRDGNANFRGRDYTYERTQAITQSEILTDVIIPQPWEIIRNLVDIWAYPKVVDTDIEIGTGLFRLQETPAILNGATLVLDCAFRQIMLAPGPTSRPASTKTGAGKSTNITHIVNTQADGLGVNITASCPLTAGEVGNGVRVSITNNSGSNGYLVFLRVNGDAVYPTDATASQAADATSQTAYGPRSLTINSYFQESSEIAQEIADWLLSVFKDPTLYPTVRIENRPTYQFNLDLYDRAELSIAAKSISANFRVGHIEHEWLNENGQAVLTTFKLEPYLAPFV